VIGSLITFNKISSTRIRHAARRFPGDRARDRLRSSRRKCSGCSSTTYAQTLTEEEKMYVQFPRVREVLGRACRDLWTKVNNLLVTEAEADASREGRAGRARSNKRPLQQRRLVEANDQARCCPTVTQEHLASRQRTPRVRKPKRPTGHPQQHSKKDYRTTCTRPREVAGTTSWRSRLRNWSASQPGVKALEQLVQLRLQIAKDRKLVNHPPEKLKELQRGGARRWIRYLRLLNPKEVRTRHRDAAPAARPV
jgi:hypothetical protein